MKAHLTILKKAASGWNADQATSMSAALSYYTIFAIAPLILIAVAVSGLFFGEEASRGEIYKSIHGLLGADGAKAVQSFVEASSIKNASITATIIGVVTLLIGATTVFAQLQDSLNSIWKVTGKPGRGLWLLLRQRLLSFSLILVIAFLLLVSLLASAILSAVGEFAIVHLPGGEVLWQFLNAGVSFGLTTLLFASIYKILPDVKLSWKDVWFGGAMTAFFFTIGKMLIGLYIGKSGVTSTYGAAGSAVLILVWTYYSSAVLLFGAEVTRFYSTRSLKKHSRLELKEGAAWKPEVALEEKPALKHSTKKPARKTHPAHSPSA
jgi:membrane protein